MCDIQIFVHLLTSRWYPLLAQPCGSETENQFKITSQMACLVIYLSRAKRVTLYLRSSFSMMYPQGPQHYTQSFPELAGGGGGEGIIVRWGELLQDG